MQTSKVSICIASYNMAGVIMDTLISCLEQDYPNKEIIVYDDCSTDNTEALVKPLQWVRYVRGKENKGVGEGFNRAMSMADGEFIVLMCADDLFTDNRFISDAVNILKLNPKIGHVSRWYYQFVNGFSGPVRAWRSQDAITQANNPSGLVFKTEALKGCRCSNKMFIETSNLVSQVVRNGWMYHVLPWDAIAVRVHGSTSTQRGYWLKRRVSSPVEDWNNIGGKEILTDYVSFIQIKNGFTIAAVWEEICNFVRLRPANLLHPGFYFFALVALICPRFILRKIPAFWRHRIGRLITKEIKRP